MNNSAISNKSLALQVSKLIRVALFIAVFLAAFFSPFLVARADAALGVIASVTSTLLGFILASAALTVSLGDKPFIQNLNKTGHMTALWSMLVRAGAGMLFALLASLIAFALSPQGIVIAISLAVAFFAVAIADLTESCTKLLKVLARL